MGTEEFRVIGGGLWRSSLFEWRWRVRRGRGDIMCDSRRVASVGCVISNVETQVGRFVAPQYLDRNRAWFEDGYSESPGSRLTGSVPLDGSAGRHAVRYVCLKLGSDAFAPRIVRNLGRVVCRGVPLLVAGHVDVGQGVPFVVGVGVDRKSRHSVDESKRQYVSRGRVEGL